MSDYGEYTPEFNSEDEVQSWLKSVFESHGWDAIREVSPHHSDRRADLLVQNSEFGWVGIEVKHLRSTDQGGKIGKAIQQILNRYQGRKFIGESVDVWCLAPYYQAQNIGHRSHEHTIRSVVNSFGVGYLNLGHNRLMMEFDYNTGDRKIFIGHLPDYPYDNSQHYEDYGDMREIKSYVKNHALID